MRLVTKPRYYFFKVLFLLLSAFSFAVSQNLEFSFCDRSHFCDFDTSMYTSSLYKHYYERILKEDTIEAEFIDVCKQNYNFLCDNMKMLSQEEPKIPKIIHQIWLGQKDFPEKYKELSEIIKKKHPQWVYKLWTDDDVEKFDFINRELYNQTPSCAEKANLLRYEILFQFGGVYLDTDFECLRSLDVFNYCCDFYAGLEYVPYSYNKFIIGNALIGSKPKHPILAALIKNISKSWYNYGTWNRINQLERSGTRFFSKIIKKVICECDGVNIILPANVFYPFAGKTIVIQPETFALHYWDSTWLKK